MIISWLLRPERLETVEEVSEPASSLRSLPHDGVRWPEQASQHTSLGTDQLASLTSLDTDQSDASIDRSQILRSQMSDDRSLTTRENVGKKVGLDPEELTYVKNPFEIFLKPQTSSSQLK